MNAPLDLITAIKNVLDNYTRYAIAFDELRYARKLLSEVCFVADRPLCEAAVHKAEEKLASTRASFSETEFEEFDF